MTKYILLIALLIGPLAWSASKDSGREVLVKLAPGFAQQMQFFNSLKIQGAKVEVLFDSWIRVKAKSTADLKALSESNAVEFIQPNYKLQLLENYRIQDSLRRAAFQRSAAARASQPKPKDNPAIPAVPEQTVGPDPDFSKQWGMNDIGAKDAWLISKGSPNMIVAVIDTGVDYTHEDLLPNMWRNPGESGNDSQGRDKASNGVDDDGNGFIDDVVGWDFAANDNLPFDLSVSPAQLLMGGGNPGHGTHCAGNVAGRGDNALGISGVAPKVKIMALRFLTEKGEGTTADAIKAIKYAVDNGAKVLSNSWGSEGEDPNEGTENQALREVIKFAMSKDVLFIAAAGNGHSGAGYDNDSDKMPGYPASYEIENIVSVAALNSSNQLGSFSNWGRKTVHLGAPGVDIYSTMVGNRYSNKVIDMGGFTVTWDGTSMATPHVAGAAALYWSANPTKTWREVKDALLASAAKVPALSGKTVSEGKLDVKALMQVK